jgi:hypothetical protein
MPTDTLWKFRTGKDLLWQLCAYPMLAAQPVPFLSGCLPLEQLYLIMVQKLCQAFFKTFYFKMLGDPILLDG